MDFFDLDAQTYFQGQLAYWRMVLSLGLNHASVLWREAKREELHAQAMLAELESV